MVKKTSGDESAVFSIEMDEPVFTSGVVCDLLRMPIWVLKQLDREEIISPKRRKGRGRLYSQREIGRLKHIWYLMSVRHVRVDGIKVILEMEAKGYKKG